MDQGGETMTSWTDLYKANNREVPLPEITSEKDDQNIIIFSNGHRVFYIADDGTLHRYQNLSLKTNLTLDHKGRVALGAYDDN